MLKSKLLGGWKLNIGGDVSPRDLQPWPRAALLEGGKIGHIAKELVIEKYFEGYKNFWEGYKRPVNERKIGRDEKKGCQKNFGVPDKNLERRQN